MLGVNGGLIGLVRDPTSSSAPGVWLLREQNLKVRDGVWPGTEADIEYTVSNNGSEFQIRDSGTVSYLVNWGDETAIETVTTNNKSHTYSAAGVYTVRLYITGSYRPYWPSAASADQVLMITIKSGVDLGTNLYRAFASLDSLIKLVIPFTATSNATSMNEMFAYTNYLTSSPGYPDLDTSNVTNIASMFSGYGNPVPTVFGTVPLYDFSEVTNAYNLFRDNKFISTVPAFDLSKCTTVALTFYACSNLTAIPAITLTSLCTNFYKTFSYTNKLASIAVINTSGGTDFREAWIAGSDDTYLTSFPALDFSSGAIFQNTWRNRDVMVNFPANMFDSTGTFVWYAFQYAWRNCALSAQSIENILVSLDTNGQSDITLHVDDGTNANASTWSIAATNAFNNLITKGWTIGKEGTISNLIYNISSSGGVFNLRSSGSVNFTVDWGDGSATETSTSNTLAHTYAAGTHLLRITTSQAYRPFFDNQGDEDQITSAGIFYNVGTTLQGAFKGAANVTSITVSSTTVTANVTDMTNAFSECTSVTSLPVFDTSSVTVFLAAFQNMDALTAFPLLNTSSGTDFENAWSNCNNLVSISSLNFSSATKFNNAWNTCPALTTFPAGRFNSTGTLTTTAFAGAFTGCALTAQSIENILVSLDANGASNVTLDIDGGTNANASTWTTPAIDAYNNLAGKGWSLSQNGTVPANSPVTGSVTISGTVEVGEVLTASNTLADPDGLGTITYQWNRGTSAISGATGTTYTLVNADDGNTMTVTASFTDGNGIPESVTSSATIIVRNYEVIYTITNSGGAFVLEDSGTVSYVVNWGDSSAPETVTTNDKSHTYASSGNYTVKLDVQTASYQGYYWNKTSRTQITSIEYKTPTKLGSSGYAAYIGCSNMTSFTAPAAAFSDLTRMDHMFRDCTSLSSFSDADTSSCSIFTYTFHNCSSLVTAPTFDYSSCTGLYQTFLNCTSLTTFPANAFNSTGTFGTNGFFNTFQNCALTAQSIENILVSLDTNGQSNVILHINGGTNAGYSTWSTAAQTALTNLTNRGWTVYKNN